MTRPLAASLLIFSLALTGCTALIEWGWDEPGQAFLRTHIAQMERKPFDGVVLHLTVPGVAPDLANFSWHLADHGYYSKRIKCCYIVIASDQGERGNLTNPTCFTARLLRPLRFALGSGSLASRNDTSIDAFTLGGRE